jgi:hypothetical protein
MIHMKKKIVVKPTITTQKTTTITSLNKTNIARIVTHMVTRTMTVGQKTINAVIEANQQIANIDQNDDTSVTSKYEDHRSGGSRSRSRSQKRQHRSEPKHDV